MIGDIDHHRTPQPFESRVKLTHPRTLPHRTGGKLPPVTGQRPWNRIEHTENLMLGPSSVFQNVGAIKVDDRPLFKIDLRKVV